MNIVWLTPEIPYPPIGGRNGVYNRIVQLSKYNQIYLYSIAYSEEEKKTEYAMKKYCREVHYYNRNSEKIKTIMKSFFMPYSVASRTISELQEGLADVMEKESIHLVIVDFPNMARNLYGLDMNCYCTLNQHNNEYRRMRDMFHIKTISFFKRVAYLVESYRLEAYEKSLYSKKMFGSITFFSSDDCAEFSRKWDQCRAKLKVFPLGANRQKKVLENKDKKHNTLLFIGRLDEVAVTNVEAVLWFCGDVLPIIRSKIKVNVIIAGSNPCEGVCRLSGGDIKVIPNYKNLEDVYSLADYIILPLLSGGGVKGKLLEAASFGKTIISTSHGIEGTEFKPDQHVLLGDSREDFAKQCVKAVNNKNGAYYLAGNAKRLFEDLYDWEQIGVKYHEFLRGEIAGGLTE